MFKTGTANQYQSIVALGATPRFTVAVWMGNFSGETVVGRTGSSLPAFIVRQLLVFLQGNGGAAFPEPQAWVKAPVCALSGMAPGPYCPVTVEEYVPVDAHLAGAVENCGWHGPGGVSYPAEYQSWFLSQNREGSLGSGPLEIISPKNGYRYLASPSQTLIPVEVTGGGGDVLSAYYDGERYDVERPFIFYLPYRQGNHTLSISCVGETASVEFSAD
jgi:penicillin-binding protein 1C